MHVFFNSQASDYKKTKLLILAFFSILASAISHQLHAQAGTAAPLIRNFSKQIYQGGTQTWDIETDSNGIVYFANNDGLIQFNGSNFIRYSLPKRTILRSVLHARGTSRIYAGGQNEIGYFEPDTRGKLQFTSLDSLMPPALKGFEDVWDICENQNQIFFLTSRQLLVYKAGKFYSYKLGTAELEHLFAVDNVLYLSNANRELYVYNTNGFQLLCRLPDAITGVIKNSRGKLVICTNKKGLFIFDQAHLSPLGTQAEKFGNARVYKALAYRDMILLASSREGLLVVNEQGDILSKTGIAQGLQNNNVLSLNLDKFENLWLGLDNGIDLLRLDYPFGYLNPDGLLKGTGYSMCTFQGVQYFGTNNGLYARMALNANNNEFRLVKGTEGQVWWVQSIGNNVYVSHHEGLFEIHGFEAKQVAAIRGCWKLIPLRSKPGYYLAGTYNGIQIFKENGQTLQLVSQPEGFQESARFAEEDANGDIWIGHPYKGLYKIRLNRDLTRIAKVQRYGKKEGLPSESDNYVFDTEDGLLFGTLKGVYLFDPIKQHFYPEAESELKEAVKRIITGKQGRIWYITSSGIYYKMPVYNGVDYSVTMRKVPESDQPLVGGFEFLREEDKGMVFLGTESGFVQFNQKEIGNYKPVKPLSWVTSVQNLNYPDSFICYMPGIFTPDIRSSEKDLIINFSSPNAVIYKELSYSSYLEGWDKDWSPWKNNAFRELGRLGYGSYLLHIKSRVMGKEGPETLIKLTIPAPWYLSTWSKIIYALIATLIILAIGIYPQMLLKRKTSRIIKEKDNLHRQQTQQLLLEKEKQERELIELRNQQLQKEIEHQGRELASSTMHIMQKSEMLLSIKDKLKKISQYSNDPKIKPEIQELIKNIEKDTMIDKDWEKFERYFNHIHDQYTLVLKEKYPVLTANDIRMCAYLRMNLSTKEIASLLNISTRGVEISRYRLRKKMGLDSGVNLSDYLTTIHP